MVGQNELKEEIKEKFGSNKEKMQENIKRKKKIIQIFIEEDYKITLKGKFRLYMHSADILSCYI